MNVLTDTLLNIYGKLFFLMQSNKIHIRKQLKLYSAGFGELLKVWEGFWTMRDAALALPGFIAGIFPSLQVSLTIFPWRLLTSVHPASHDHQTYRKRALPFYFETKVRSRDSFIACCCHKTLLSFCSNEHSHHSEHQSSPIFFCINTLTSLPFPYVDSCHVLIFLDEINSCLHPHPILPAFSSLAET